MALMRVNSVKCWTTRQVLCGHLYIYKMPVCVACWKIFRKRKTPIQAAPPTHSLIKSLAMGSVERWLLLPAYRRWSACDKLQKILWKIEKIPLLTGHFVPRAQNDKSRDKSGCQGVGWRCSLLLMKVIGASVCLASKDWG